MTYRNVRWNLQNALVFLLRGAFFPGGLLVVLIWITDLTQLSAAAVVWMGAWAAVIGTRALLGSVTLTGDQVILRNPYRTVRIRAHEIDFVGRSAVWQLGGWVPSLILDCEGKRRLVDLIPMPANDVEIVLEWLERVRPGWGGETSVES